MPKEAILPTTIELKQQKQEDVAIDYRKWATGIGIAALLTGGYFVAKTTGFLGFVGGFGSWFKSNVDEADAGEAVVLKDEKVGISDKEGIHLPQKSASRIEKGLKLANFREENLPDLSSQFLEKGNKLEEGNENDRYDGIPQLFSDVDENESNNTTVSEKLSSFVVKRKQITEKSKLAEFDELSVDNALIKYVNALNMDVWRYPLGMTLWSTGAMTKNPLIMGVGVLACYPQVEAQSSSSASSFLWQEDFDGATLDPSWEVVNREPYGRYSLTDNPGYLRYYVEGSRGRSGGWRDGYITSGGWSASTTLLKPFGGTQWELQVKADHNLHYHVGGSSPGSQAGEFYVAFGTGVDNFLKIDRIVDYAYTANILAVYIMNTNGTPDLIYNDSYRAPDDIEVNEWMRYTYYYKIERNNEDVSIYISFDGSSYNLAESFILPLSIGDTQKIILDETCWTSVGSYVDWDYFHVTELTEAESSNELSAGVSSIESEPLSQASSNLFETSSNGQSVNNLYSASSYRNFAFSSADEIKKSSAQKNSVAKTSNPFSMVSGTQGSSATESSVNVDYFSSISNKK